MYISQVKCFEFRICSFYENINLKNAILLHVSFEFQELEKQFLKKNLAFSALGKLALSKFIDMQLLYIQHGQWRQCYITKQLVHSFSANMKISQPLKVMFTSAKPK